MATSYIERACARCGQVKRIVARNLCGRCYQSLHRAGNLERYPASARRGRPTARSHQRAPDWRAIAEGRKGEIDRLRARIAELEATNGKSH